MGYHSAQLVNWKGAIETTYIFLNMHSPIKCNRISFFFLHGTYKLGRALEQTWLQVHNWTENKGKKFWTAKRFYQGLRGLCRWVHVNNSTDNSTTRCHNSSSAGILWQHASSMASSYKFNSVTFTFFAMCLKLTIPCSCQLYGTMLINRTKGWTVQLASKI